MTNYRENNYVIISAERIANEMEVRYVYNSWQATIRDMMDRPEEV